MGDLDGQAAQRGPSSRRGGPIPFEEDAVLALSGVHGHTSRPRRATRSIIAAAALAAASLFTLASLPQPSQSSWVDTSVAHAATGPKAYVGLFKEDAVAVVDTGTDTVLSKIAVPSPHGIAPTLDGKKVYVSSDGGSTVSVIDTANDSVMKTLEVGKAPHGITLTPDGKLAVVGVWSDNQVAFVDTSTDQIVRRSPVGNPHNMAVTPDGAFVYVGSQSQDSPSLVKLNVATGEQVASLPLDGAPRGLSVKPDGSQVYLTRAGQDDVLVVNTADNQPAGKITVGASPHFPSFTSTGQGLVNVQGPGLLTSIDPATNTVLGTASVGKMPHWQAVTADGKTAFETNEGSNDISVVDLASMAVKATIPVGEAPRKIALLPGDALASMPGMPGMTAMAAPTTSAGGQQAAPAASQGQASQGQASQGQAAAAAPGDVEVRISKLSFGGPVTIEAGQTVSWVNDDTVTHTVEATDGSWDLHEVEPGQRVSKRFDAAGTYEYYCDFHQFMRSQVVVQ
jgi:YVTN family beta-propeller protein